MSAEAMQQREAPRAAVIREIEPKLCRTSAAKARVLRLPGPEALLHPRAAEALVLAFRPLSWGR
jgi:hypothetical protein